MNDSEVAAECLGVNTYALRVRVFVLAAGYAGLAGVFYAHWLAVVSPEAAGFELSVTLLLMVVLGGLGTVWGAVIGAVAVEALDEGMRSFIPKLIPGASGEVQLLGFGIVLVLLVVLLPGGLAQLWARLTRRRGTAAASACFPGLSSTAPCGDGVQRSAGPLPPARPGGRDRVRLAAPLNPWADDALRRCHCARGHRSRCPGRRDLCPHRPERRRQDDCLQYHHGRAGADRRTITPAGHADSGPCPHVVSVLGATRTFQNLQVFGSTTVLGNVKVARHLRSRSGILRGMLGLAGREEREIEDWARTAVAALGLTEHADRPVTDLAFGQQRKVEVARALALAPALLLLDEPMAGLSGTERDSLAWLLRRVRSAGISVLLVEHDVDAVMALADRVAVLDDGRLIALGEPEDVRANPAVIAAYLGTDADDDSLVRTAALVVPV